MVLDKTKLFCTYLVYGKKNNHTTTHLTNELGELFTVMEKENFFQKSSPTKEIECSLCENNHFVKVVKIKDRFYINCDETGLLKKLDNAELLSYKINPIGVCTWLISQLSLEGNIEEIDEEYLYLGKTTGGDPNFNIYLVFTDNFEIVEKIYETLTNKPKILLWCGDTPHRKAIIKNIIPLHQLFQIKNNHLEINKQPFTDILATISLRAIEKTKLRNDIEIKKEDERHYLLLGKNKSLNIYNHTEAISPQSYRLLETFDTKNTDLTLQDLVDESVAMNKRTVSTRIKDVNALCKKSGVEPILRKTDKTHWKLNSP